MTKKLESKIISKKRILLLVLNYFIGYMFLYPLLLKRIFILFKLDIKTYDFLSLLIYIGMIAFCFIVGFPILKESIQRFPKIRKYFESVLLTFVALYFISGITSTIVMLVTNTDQSANQTLIIEAFKQSPLMIAFSILIYAPFVEEMVFRGAIFRGLRSRFSFITAGLISGLSFGMIHVFDSLLAGNFIDLWYLLTYGALGFLFCYSYEKNKTFFAPMLLHFINNFLGLIGIIVSVYLA